MQAHASGGVTRGVQDGQFGATHFICPDGPDFDLIVAVKEICPIGVDYVFEWFFRTVTDPTANSSLGVAVPGPIS